MAALIELGEMGFEGMLAEEAPLLPVTPTPTPRVNMFDRPDTWAESASYYVPRIAPIAALMGAANIPNLPNASGETPAERTARWILDNEAAKAEAADPNNFEHRQARKDQELKDLHDQFIAQQLELNDHKFDDMSNENIQNNNYGPQQSVNWRDVDWSQYDPPVNTNTDLHSLITGSSSKVYYDNQDMSWRGSVKNNYSFGKKGGVNSGVVAGYRRQQAYAKRGLGARVGRKSARNTRAKGIVKKLKALVKGKTKDSPDVDRTVGYAGSGTSTKHCLTSSTAADTAAGNTGLLTTDSDQVRINYIHFKGVISNTCTVDTDVTGSSDVLYRKMLVWFMKPKLDASAAGTLPPITEVLTADNIAALPVSATNNSGRFKVLMDKTYTLGLNQARAAVTTSAYPSHGGAPTMIPYDFKIKIGKDMKLTDHMTLLGGSGVGHFDSDINAGQVSGGLLVLYTQAYYGGTASLQDIQYTRVNYTA